MTFGDLLPRCICKLENPLQVPGRLPETRGTTLVLSNRGGDSCMVEMMRCDPDDPFRHGRVRGEALL
jgi:hypothetical protein